MFQQSSFFFRRRLFRAPKFDEVALSSLVAVSGATVLLAYQEGRSPISDQVRGNECAYEYDVRQFNLTPTKCRQLETDGFLVIDDFLSSKELRHAAHSARMVESRGPTVASGGGGFGASPNEKEDNNLKEVEKATSLRSRTQTAIGPGAQSSPAGAVAGVRTDRVCWIGKEHCGTADNRSSKQDKSGDEKGLRHIRTLLRGIAHSISESGFQGFKQSETHEVASLTTTCSGQDDVYMSKDSWVGVPGSMQVSMYETLEGRSTTDNPRGAYYRAHRDGCMDTFLEMGLLGFLRSRYLRKRYITCIVYLNETQADTDHPGGERPWTKEDGGYLRLFIGADSTDDTGESVDKNSDSGARIVDIEPRGGRLVLFSSEHVLHAVLPSFRKRVACTIWLTLN